MNRNCVSMLFALCVMLAQGALWADGVTRSVESVPGGCRVTLTWDFHGSVESALILEERFAAGWSVDDKTVPFSSCDATWFSGQIARFAVKPSLVEKTGSISFTVMSETELATGSVTGNWRMYLDGTLQNGTVVGSAGLSALKGDVSVTSVADNTADEFVEMPVSIKSFKVLDGSRIELSYAGLVKAGTLVVEGCEGLGKTWMEVKRQEVSAGEGTVNFEQGACRFYRMKLLTKE